MAPKAKPDAKSKPKPKKEPKKEDEEEKPKVSAPDNEAHQAALSVIQEAIDGLQKKTSALNAQVKERSGGKDEFFTQKGAIKAELDDVSSKISALQTRREEIQKLIGNKREEQASMRGELNKMKRNMTFSSEKDIDDRIAAIEFKLWTDSVPLKEEKKLLAEIQDLKRNKPKLSQVAGMEDKLKGLNDTLSLKEQNKQIMEQINKFRDQKTEINAKYKALQESRQAQLGDLPQIIEQRDALQKEIQAKIMERNQLRDKFGEEKRAYQKYQAELRDARRARVEAERQERDQARRKEQLQREVEKMDVQPHADEITLIEQTIKFCKSLLPQEVAEKKEDKKETVYNNKEGETVLLKKEARDEEFYFEATVKAKKGKSKKKTSGSEGGAKPIKHNAETFKLFDKLKLDAPVTTAEIPKLLEALDAQMEDYQAKVKKWEEEKEEKKRQILESGKLPGEDEEEEEPEKAEAEEEEKAEEEEAAPEEEKAEEEEKADEEEEEKAEEKEEEEEAKDE